MDNTLNLPDQQKTVFSKSKRQYCDDSSTSCTRLFSRTTLRTQYEKRSKSTPNTITIYTTSFGRIVVKFGPMDALRWALPGSVKARLIFHKETCGKTCQTRGNASLQCIPYMSRTWTGMQHAYLTCGMYKYMRRCVSCTFAWRVTVPSFWFLGREPCGTWRA